jgi:hydroxymethylbilane synthase
VKPPLKIGTRGSKLALWQANLLRDALFARFDVPSEIVVVKTSGDIQATTPIEQLGKKGVFTAELEQALFDGRADVAIHSLKDMPTEIDDVCRAAIIFEREDPRDALISRGGETLEKLPARARVGTSSLRRAAQLRRARPDLDVLEIRGNVDTRIRKLDEGEFDAIVLAKAGVKRLGLENRITQTIEPQIMLPAVGQGALAVEYMEMRDDLYMEFFQKLEHLETVLAVSAERKLMSTLHGGCRLPLGAWARFDGPSLVLDACVFSEDGTQAVRGGGSIPAAAAARGNGSVTLKDMQDVAKLGADVAKQMLADGAGPLLAAAGREVL